MAFLEYGSYQMKPLNCIVGGGWTAASWAVSWAAFGWGLRNMQQVSCETETAVGVVYTYRILNDA